MKNISILLVILLILSEKMSWQISFFITVSLLFIYIIKYGIPNKFIDINKELIIIFIIGSLSGVYYVLTGKYELIDCLRDMMIFITPITYITLGIFLSKYKNISEYDIYKTYIYSGIALSILHIGDVIINFKEISLGIENRALSGTGSSITILALIMLIFSEKEFKIAAIKSNFIRKFSILLLLTSFVFYFSRTDLVLFFSFIIVILLVRKKINIKGCLKKIINVILILILVFNIAPRKTMDEFITKLTRSFTEVSSDNSIWTWDRINTDWRGYEVYRAKIEISGWNSFKYICGAGFGEQVDLGLQMKLGDEWFTKIPILHNGYYYIMLKTGVLGIILYLLFLIKLFIIGCKKILLNKFNFRYKLLCGMSLGLIFSTYVVSGLYNREGILAYCILIGFIRDYKIKKE